MVRVLSRLVVLSVVFVFAASLAFGQEEGKKKGDRKAMDPEARFKAMDENKDGKVNQAEFVKSFTRRAGEDKERQAKMEEMAKGMFKKMAGDKTELTLEDYVAAVKKLGTGTRGERGGKKRGEKQ